LHDRNEVAYSVNADRSRGFPYMPRPFPRGLWRVTGVEWTGGEDPRTKDRNAPYRVNPYWPVKILTDAHQRLPVWKLDGEGGYERETDALIEDWGYALHYGNGSLSTLGCGNIATAEQAGLLGKLVEGALRGGEEIQLEVIYE
jgi:hypothetical protein